MRNQNDLLASLTPPKHVKSNRKYHVLIVILCALIFLVSYIFFANRSPTPVELETALTLPDLTAKIENSATAQVTPPPLGQLNQTPVTTGIGKPTQSMQSHTTVWQEYKVKSGDSLSEIFSDNDLPRLDLYKIIHANDISYQFTSIRPGKSLMIGRDFSGKLTHLTYKKNIYKLLKATRNDTGDFTVELVEREMEKRLRTATGSIQSSLFIDGKKAGLTDSTIMQFANIFAWDIDMAMSLRVGDKFAAIYEELYIDNIKVGTGKILAAEFVNRGKSFKAVRFENPEGKSSYYTEKGNSMQKAFLRTPIDFARISSRFNLRRKHPVLNRIRAHKGVDYAAAKGTPIKAAGAGKIIFRGRQRGYGKVVILQHRQKYSTLYAHMSRFRKGQRKGSQVHQGDIIGYVGSTGLASGPHLHYEFRINGVHRNPLTVKLPNSTPIKATYKADFIALSKPLFAQLEQLIATSIAVSASAE
ncbi:MAG: peptidoglycan DD-metalloendopeptidase family protein [Methyloprofundus sp.]|nr:peptidoglycan DD-metalloendopeptidase family protein [Methyloprofundus sp.]